MVGWLDGWMVGSWMLGCLVWWWVLGLCCFSLFASGSHFLRHWPRNGPCLRSHQELGVVVGVGVGSSPEIRFLHFLLAAADTELSSRQIEAFGEWQWESQSQSEFQIQSKVEGECEVEQRLLLLSGLPNRPEMRDSWVSLAGKADRLSTASPVTAPKRKNKKRYKMKSATAATTCQNKTKRRPKLKPVAAVSFRNQLFFTLLIFHVHGHKCAATTCNSGSVSVVAATKSH